MTAKKFSITVLVFLCIQITAYISLEIFSTTYRNNYTDKYDFFLEQKDNIDTVILGSSHAYYGINPYFLTLKAYNLANVSQAFYYDKEVLKYALSKANIKNVIIPFSLFSHYLLTPEKLRPSYKFYTPIKEPKHFQELSKDKIELLDSLRIAHIGLEKMFDFHTNEYEEVIEKNGFMPAIEKLSEERFKKAAEGASKRHLPYISEKYEDVPKALEELISFCFENNLSVFFVTLPVHSEYLQYIDKKLLESFIEYNESLSKKYGIPYFNYLKGEQYDFIDEIYFYDPDHLSAEGAKKFTLLLNEEIKNFINHKEK